MNQLRRTLQITLPLVLLAGGALGAKALAGLRKPPAVAAPETVVPIVRAVEAVQRPVRLEVRTHGTVSPRTETRLVSEVGGRIVRVAPALARGGFFDAGEELLALDPTDYVLALEETRARLATAEAALQREEADAELARRDWETLGGDRKASPLVLHEPQLQEARSQVAAAQAALAKAERDVERCTILAPYPGRVRDRAVDLGQYVDRGHELARVYAVDWAEIRLPVPDEELARLELPLDPGGWSSGPNDAPAEPWQGPAVRLSADFAGGERSWEGRVVRIEGEIDPDSRMVVLVARVEDPYGRAAERGRAGAPLMAGLFVDATLAGRELAAAVVLPRAALQPGPRVYVLDREQRLAFRDVQVLQADRDEVVLGSGVEPGEAVIVSPLELPVEGMQLARAAEERR